MSVLDLIAQAAAAAPRNDASDKEVVQAVVGACGTMGGFVLVFLGFVLSRYDAYDATAPGRDKWKHAGWTSLAAFVLSLASLATSTSWLVFDGGGTWSAVVVVVFACALTAVLGMACWTTVKALG